MYKNLAFLVAVLFSTASLAQGSSSNIYQRPSPFTPGATFGPQGQVYIPAPTAPQNTYVQPAPSKGVDSNIYNQIQYPPPVRLEDPLDQEARRMQLRQMELDIKLRELQIRELQKRE